MRQLPPQRALMLTAALLFAALVVIAIPARFPSVDLLVLPLCTFAVGVTILHRSVRPFRLRMFSIPGLWFLGYLSMILIPAVFLGSDPSRRSALFLHSTEIVGVAVPVGVALANGLLRFRFSELREYHERDVTVGRRNDAVTRYAIALAAGCAIVAAYFREVRDVPLVALVQGADYGTLTQLRETSFKLLQSPLKPFYTMFRDTVFPILVPCGVAYFAVTRERRWRSIALLAAVVALLFSSLSLARLPPFALVIVTILTLYAVRRGSWRWSLIAAAFVALAFPFVVTLVSRGGSWRLASIALVQRLFVGPANVLYYYFEVVPRYLPFQGGRTMGLVVELFGSKPFDIGNFVSLYISPQASVRSGSANAAFPGALYVDFGLAGVVVGALFAGLAMQFVQVYLVRTRKTPFTVAVYAYSCYTFVLLNILPLPSVVLYSGLVPVLFLVHVTGRAVLANPPPHRATRSLELLRPKAE